MKPICKNCKWATWSYGPRGGLLHQRAGRCDHPRIQLPNLPVCTRAPELTWLELDVNWRRNIWLQDRKECPTFAMKEIK